MLHAYAGNAVDPLLDAELWAPLYRAIREARREILLTQLLFDAGFRPGETRVTDELQAAAERGVDVRILVNENAAVPDSYDELVERFAGTSVRVERMLMTPNVLHAKLLLVDGEEAFMIDAPFEQKYVDSSAHAFSATRGRERPFHTVSVRVRGPAVAGLHELAAQLFAGAASEPPPPVPEPRAAGSVPLRIACTAPEGALGERAVLDVVEEYERAIAGARRFIYLENQYFTSPRIRDALAAALAREPRLEVILLLNVHMDLPGYDVWLRRRLDELGAREHPRLAAFALWAPRRVEESVAARQVYVHSKVGIVDDRWATVGSANLDSISLHEADEFPVPGRMPPNIEANLVIEDEGFAARLRRRLWAEHLRDGRVWAAGVPAGGWLAHWRTVAQENLRRFELGDVRNVGRVFPYDLLTSERRKGLFGRGSAST